MVGVVEDGSSPDPDLLLRYLYTPPTGRRTRRPGRSPAGCSLTNNRTTVDTYVQTVADSATHAAGAPPLTLSLPADPATLASGVTLTDTAGALLVEGTDYVALPLPDGPEVLALLPLAGWAREHAYRVTLTTDLADTAGRPLRPGMADLPILIPAEGAVTAAAPPDLAIAYDSVAAASATLGGRFPGGQTLLFQGLWTDPTTGLAHARNRWYDPHNASWLSEDPLGPVDSVNLYAFVGWGPHMGTDPLGLRDPNELDIEMMLALRERTQAFAQEYRDSGEADVELARTVLVDEAAWYVPVSERGMRYETRWATYRVSTDPAYYRVLTTLVRDELSYREAVQRADEEGAIAYYPHLGFRTQNSADREENAQAEKQLAAVIFVTQDLPAVIAPFAQFKMIKRQSRASETLGRATEEGMTQRTSQGNRLHYDRLSGGQGEGLPTDLQRRFPNTEFRFARRGQRGADALVVGGQHPSEYPGSTWPPTAMRGDFKPDTTSGHRRFRSEVRNGKLPEDTVMLPYDPSSGTLR